MAAAAIVFFAFYGFDAVATSAEEAKNPGRDLTIGIIGSMAVCTLIYMLVAVSAVGAVSHTSVGSSAEPLAHRDAHARSSRWPRALIGLAALIALPSVILVMMYGQSRIFFVMARDGLLPRRLSSVSAAHRRARTHHCDHRRVRGGRGRILPARRDRRARQRGHAAGIHRHGRLHDDPAKACAGNAARVPLSAAHADRHAWRLLGCLYLIASLPEKTLVRFALWNLFGIGVYFAYGRWRSLQRRPGQ